VTSALADQIHGVEVGHTVLLKLDGQAADRVRLASAVQERLRFAPTGSQSPDCHLGVG
jgi:hypothetical protein